MDLKEMEPKVTNDNRKTEAINALLDVIIYGDDEPGDKLKLAEAIAKLETTLTDEELENLQKAKIKAEIEEIKYKKKSKFRDLLDSYGAPIIKAIWNLAILVALVCGINIFEKFDAFGGQNKGIISNMFKWYMKKNNIG